jgi:hypothetical protein
MGLNDLLFERFMMIKNSFPSVTFVAGLSGSWGPPYTSFNFHNIG